MTEVLSTLFPSQRRVDCQSGRPDCLYILELLQAGGGLAVAAARLVQVANGPISRGVRGKG